MINLDLAKAEVELNRIAESSLATALKAVDGSSQWALLTYQRKRALKTRYLKAKRAKLAKVITWMKTGNWAMLASNINELNPGWKAIFEAATGLNIPSRPDKAEAFLVNLLWKDYVPLFNLKAVPP
jgi:hypothetical protein